MYFVLKKIQKKITKSYRLHKFTVLKYKSSCIHAKEKWT